MDIEKIFEETDFSINDKVLASADFGDLSSELDEPFYGVLRGTFSYDSVFTHRRSLERHRISIHTTSALFHCKLCKKRFNRKDNFVRHSKIHKLTLIIMKLSRTANGEENSSANISSEAATGPSIATETTLSDHTAGLLFLQFQLHRRENELFRPLSELEMHVWILLKCAHSFQILQHRRT
ncbi:hypothetical protein TNCV_774811 [Trichonephila clavipes]|nr:hypothetical protein TNCV_774811 [Trichonephila clavipes]